MLQNLLEYYRGSFRVKKGHGEGGGGGAYTTIHLNTAIACIFPLRETCGYVLRYKFKSSDLTKE